MTATLLLALTLMVAAPDDYADTYRQAQAAQVVGRHAEAVPLFEKAVHLEPESESALAGLMTSLIALERWDRAAEIGKAALSVDPESETFRKQAAYAERRLEEDSVQARASVSGFGVGYTDGALLSQQWGLNVAASAGFPGGFGLWLGGTFSQGQYADGTGTYQQSTPTFGLTYSGANFYGSLSGTYVAVTESSATSGLPGPGGLSRPGAPSSTTTSGGVVSFTVGGGGEVWGLALKSSVTLGRDSVSLQLNPTLKVRVADGVTLEAGPEVQVHGDETLGSAHAAATITLVDSVTLRLGGYGGARRYAVEADGMTVYTGSERYRAGGHLNHTWQAARWIALGARFGAEYGDEVDGEAQEFTALGAGLFVNLKF